MYPLAINMKAKIFTRFGMKISLKLHRIRGSYLDKKTIALVMYLNTLRTDSYQWRTFTLGQTAGDA